MQTSMLALSIQAALLAMMAAVVAGSPTQSTVPALRTCQATEPGNVLVYTDTKLVCLYPDRNTVQCKPSNNNAFQITFALAASGRIDKVTLQNTPNAPGTTSKERKVYYFTTDGTTFYYHLEGYSSCQVSYSELNPFGKFDQDKIQATVSDNVDG